jgi:hypothetical protein
MEGNGMYAFGRTDRWRTHMRKEHGVSKEEVQSIMKKGIPMEKKIIEETQNAMSEELWGFNDDEDLLGEDDNWNDIDYEDGE